MFRKYVWFLYFVLLAGCGNSQWVTYTSQTARFTAEFPNHPKRGTQNLTIGKYKIKGDTFITLNEENYYNITYAKYPDVFTDKQNQAILSDFSTRMSAINKRSLLRSQELIVDGKPCAEIQMELMDNEIKGGAFCTQRMVTDKNHIYQLQVISPSKKKNDAEAKRFFSAFKIIK